MEKVLSIAIPTLNRSRYLKFTIDNFLPQIEKNKDKVELLVCNNASDDETVSVMETFVKEHDYIKFYNYDNRVPLGDSFKRTAGNARGKFLILWGDDDIPAPFLIDYLLYLISSNQDVELYYFNRLVGYEDNETIKSLSVYDNRYDRIRKVYDDSSEFIAENFWGATFMSAMLFSKSVWERGLSYDTSSHYGFEFMGILYYGNKGRKIIRENFPLCIQRKVAQRAWGTDWPIYALLGLPNMSKDLEHEGLYKNGLNLWRTQYNKFVLFCYILMSAATDKKKYRPYCRQFASYQESLLRKVLVYIIIYAMPGWVYTLSRKVLFKLKG